MMKMSMVDILESVLMDYRELEEQKKILEEFAQRATKSRDLSVANEAYAVLGDINYIKQKNEVK